jgi:hypothetical protein
MISVEGWNNITLYCNDTSNNIGSDNVTFYKDTVAPEFVDLTNQTGEFSEPFEYDVNASDVSGVSCFEINDTTNFIINCSGYLQNNTDLSLGLYWINISVNDTFGNTNSVLLFVNITDTTPPIFTDFSNITFDYRTGFDYDINATDANGVSCFSVNDTINFQINCSGYLENKTAIDLGIYSLNITVNDTYGNERSDSLIVNATIFNTAPFITANISFSNHASGHAFNASATVNDSEGATDIRIASIDISSGSCNQLSNSSDGDAFTVTFNCSGISQVLVYANITFNDSANLAATTGTSSFYYPNNIPTNPTDIYPFGGQS